MDALFILQSYIHVSVLKCLVSKTRTKHKPAYIMEATLFAFVLLCMCLSPCLSALPNSDIDWSVVVVFPAQTHSIFCINNNAVKH